MLRGDIEPIPLIGSPLVLENNIQADRIIADEIARWQNDFSVNMGLGVSNDSYVARLEDMRIRVIDLITYYDIDEPIDREFVDHAMAMLETFDAWPPSMLEMAGRAERQNLARAIFELRARNDARSKGLVAVGGWLVIRA